MDAENKRVYLINYTFSENGRGVSTYAIRLYNELLKRKVNIEKIATNDILKKIKLGRELKNSLFFITRSKIIKGKFIHAIAPNVIPQKYLNLPKIKITTVHDFYIFDDNYINKTKVRMSYIKRIAYDRLIKKQRKDYYNLKDYDFVFARNKNILQKLMSDFGVDKERVEVSNDIIPDKFQPLNIEKDKNKVIIGFINNFTENKTEKLKLFIIPSV